MAKNREPKKSVESDEEEEDAESDSGPVQTQVTKRPSSSAPATLKKTQPQEQRRRPPSSPDEEESGFESESESGGPDPNVRPIASKPVDDLPKSNSGSAKANASEQVTPAKRPAEEKETEAKNAKKSKKKPEAENSGRNPNDDSKKFLFQRLWSEDDEIEILKGMIDYKTKKKSDPIADLSTFHDFIKKNLHVDVTRTQLQDKIRRLKKKFENNKSKEKEGKDRTFSKPHDQKAYELSKRIWGKENGTEKEGEKTMGSPQAVRETSSKRANVAENEVARRDVKSAVVVTGDGERLLPAKRVSVEDRILMTGSELFEGGKGVEGEKEWKKLRYEEMEVHLRLLELRSAQTKLVLDVLKSRDR